MSDPSASASRLQDFLRKVASLAEPAMRLARLTECLRELADEQGASLLDALVLGALQKDSSAGLVYTSIIDPTPLAQKLGVGRLERLGVRAEEQNLVGAKQWVNCSLLPAEPLRARRDLLVHKDLRELTLGTRRALARRASGEVYKKLLIDPDPGVVSNLLRNARTTEQLVLALCSQRPTVSDALEAVLASPRFGQRYRVRRALAQNPHLRQAVAINLLPTLERADLLAVRDDGALALARRESAQRLLDYSRWALAVSRANKLS